MLKQYYKRRRSIWLTVIASTAVIMTILAVIMLVPTKLTAQQWQDIYTKGTYHPGTRIDGIDVSGMTLLQADKIVRENMQQRILAVHIVIKNNDKQYVLGKDDFLIADNVDKVLKEAMGTAREGSRMDINRKLDSIKKNGLDFTTDYTVNPMPVKKRIINIALEVDVPAKDATVEVHKNDKDNRFGYTDEANGYKVDQDALYTMISKQLKTREYGTIMLPIVEVPPQVTKAQLKANTVLRAKAVTSFAKSPYNRDSRVYNIKKAVKLINGYVLKAGERFSTNFVLGPRVYEMGWQPAPAVVQGTSEDQAGGGVCQVSTTMYNAVLKADLEVINRQGHSIKLSYVDGGLDATINTGTIDFVYSNSTGHDIYIFCWVNSGEQTVNFAIYGEPFAGEYDEIRLSSEKLETLQPPGDMIVMVDKTKAPGYQEVVVKRRDGYVYATYKHFYKDGVEVKEPELIGKTKYKPYAGEMIVGPPAPAVADQPLPEASQQTDSTQPANSEGGQT